MSYGSNLHVAQALTDLAVAYKPSDNGFLRDKFFPRKDVTHLTDKIRQVQKSNALLLHDLKVGNDGRVPEVQYRIDTDIVYNCQAYGAEVVIGDMDIDNADAALIHEQRQLEHAMFVVANALEYVAINQTLRSTSVLTQNKTLTSSTLWDAYGSASSDPIGDLLNACTITRYNTGKDVNRIAMSETVWNVIIQHPNVQERVRLNGAAGSLLTKEILAGILRVKAEDILISNQVYNSADMSATAVYKSFMGSDVIVAHVDEPSMYDYSLGHEFAFSGYGSSPVVIVKYRDERRGGLLGSNVIRAGSIVDFHVTQPLAGFLLKTTLNVSNSAYGGYVD